MSSPNLLNVVPVSKGRQWKDFIRVRRDVYRNDPSVVLPLSSMEKMQLDEEKNPFYQHATRQAFVAYRGKTAVGRIVAIKDTLHNEYYNDKVGFFGFFECEDDPDVAKLLLENAKAWLIEQGCDTIRGPVNPSMKSDFGVLMTGHEIPPFIMMGHTPLYYDQLLLKNGLSVAKEFYAYRYVPTEHDTTEKWKRLDRTAERIRKRYPQLVFKPVSEAGYDGVLRDINRLGNSVRAANYGFVPLTEPELAFMIKQLRRVIRLDMIHVAYWNDKLVGFIVNVPDVNWALKKTKGTSDWFRMPQLLYWVKRTPRSRVIAMGVDENYRKKGIAMLLIQCLARRCFEYQEWELSWVVEDNTKSIGAISAAMPMHKSKVYRIYESPIGLEV